MNKSDDEKGHGTCVSGELRGKDINSYSGILMSEEIFPCSIRVFDECIQVNKNHLFAKFAFFSQKYECLMIKSASNSYGSISKTGVSSFQIYHYSYHNPGILLLYSRENKLE
jgi:hypothetical protein